MTKHPKRSNLREGGFKRTQSIQAGKGRQQKVEAADHILSTVRKPRAMNSGAQHAAFFSLSPGPQSSNKELLYTSMVNLPSSVKLL